MIIVMKKNVKKGELDKVLQLLRSHDLAVHVSHFDGKVIAAVKGCDSRLLKEDLEAVPGVEKVSVVSTPYKLTSRDFKNRDTVITVDDVTIGGNELQIMAGPCAVESREQVLEIAAIVKECGGRIMRGGAYKPRTSPYSFQGLQEIGLEYLAEAKRKTGILIISEVMDTESVEMVANYVDILQIGARNMQNFTLLKKVAKTNKPVLLKRGLSATIEEWIMAAEYILSGGNEKVILCERGIRTFETYTRNTLDLSVVPIIKRLTHLPIVVDPSHGTGSWKLVNPISKAAVVTGADGLMIEVHPDPDKALSDGPQSLKPEKFYQLVNELKPLTQIVGKEIRTETRNKINKTGTEG